MAEVPQSGGGGRSGATEKAPLSPFGTTPPKGELCFGRVLTLVKRARQGRVQPAVFEAAAQAGHVESV